MSRDEHVRAGGLASPRPSGRRVPPPPAADAPAGVAADAPGADALGVGGAGPRLVAEALDLLPHAVLVLDGDRRVHVANARARALLGNGGRAASPAAVALGHPPPADGPAPREAAALDDLLPGVWETAVGACCARALREGRSHTADGGLPGRTGVFRAHALPTAAGGVVVHLRDATADGRVSAPPAAGGTDVLTGLPNRQALLRHLAGPCAVVGGTTPGAPPAAEAALLVLDLDGFGALNATHGHDAGDAVLRQLGARLARAVRSSDLVARVGADAFGVLLRAGALEEPVRAAARLQEVLAAPVALDDSPEGPEGGEGAGPEGDARLAPPDRAAVQVSASAAVFPLDGVTPGEALLRHADAMLARGRAGGRGRVTQPSAAARAEFLARDLLAASLQGAIRWLRDDPGHGRHGFSLVHQPIVELATGAPTGVEALLRWTDPVLGRVSPADFIPLAEELELISVLGRWVLETACREIGAAHPTLGVSVNVSGPQLGASSFADEVAAALSGAGMPAARLTLELTETALVRDVRRARRVLGELRARGVHVAIDDFGAGYSSLAYLQQLPLDVLKLDKSYVDNLARSRGGPSVAVPRAMVALGHALGLRTVGEGVETAGQRDALQALGCDRAQGYHFGRPMPVGELGPWLTAAAPSAAPAT